MISNNQPTNEYRPMSAWGYIGYQILFAIPLVGIILIIIFALDNNYIARRNFARSIILAFMLVIFSFIVFGGVFVAAISSIINSIPVA